MLNFAYEYKQYNTKNSKKLLKKLKIIKKLPLININLRKSNKTT